MSLLAVVAVAVLIAAFAIWRMSQPTGVFAGKYQGRTLQGWYDATRYDARDAPTVEEFEAAMRAIASNHVPELIAALAYDPRPRAAKFKSFLGWLPGSSFHRLYAGPLRDRHAAHILIAQRALFSLGPDLVHALPQLETLASGTNDFAARRTYQIIYGTGTNCLPFLLQVAADEKNPRRENAAFALELLAEDTPQKLSSAIPVLERCASSQDPNVANSAKMALERITAALPPPAAKSDATGTNASARP